MFFEILLVAIGGEPPFKEEFRKAALRNFPVQCGTTWYTHLHLTTVRPVHSDVNCGFSSHRLEQHSPLI